MVFCVVTLCSVDRARSFEGMMSSIFRIQEQLKQHEHVQPRLRLSPKYTVICDIRLWFRVWLSALRILFRAIHPTPIPVPSLLLAA
jgi:hypothetical protein